MQIHRMWALSLLGVLLTVYSAPRAHAFVPVRSANTGAVVRWPEGSQLTFRANTTNSSGLAAADIFSIFTASLSRWKDASFNGFSFLYYQGTDTSRFPNYLSSPYDNSIFFTSNAGSSEQLSCGVIGLTQLWFSSSGVATKADVRFNDKCYQFTTNPLDTGAGSRVFLGDVATHELGHALGLDHSQNLQSSMIYTAAPEMAYPSCDDRAAMLKLYGGGTRAQTGGLGGRVLAPSGAAIFGAHVNAISLDRGVAIASTLTEPDGSFQIEGLPPGQYTAVVEPYYPGPGPLGAFYKGIQNAVCPGGALFQRTFLNRAGVLVSATIAAGTRAGLGEITVSCSAPNSNNGYTEFSFGSAPTIASSPVSVPVGAQGVFGTTVDQYFRLENEDGTLVASALAYSLFSPVDVDVEFLDETGARIAGQQAATNAFTGSGGFTNFDGKARVTLSGTQDVIVHIFSRGKLPTWRYPSGGQTVAATAYYIVSVSRGATGGVLPDNARCEAEDTFSPYPNLGEPNAFGSKEETSGCSIGSISDDDEEGGSPGPRSPIRLINFLGLALMLTAARRLLLTSYTNVRLCQ